MKPSLKSLILDYCKMNYPYEVHSGAIEKLSIEKGFKASNGSRRARELEEDGYLEKRIEKKCVIYKYRIEKQVREAYQVDSVDREKKIIYLKKQGQLF